MYRLKNWDYSPRTGSPGSFAPRPIGYDVVPQFLRGLVAVRVNADESISIELAPSTNGETAAFTGDVRTYRR